MAQENKTFDQMDFEMFEEVEIPWGPDEWKLGTIIGRSEHRDTPPAYQVEYMAQDGLNVGGYSEAEIRKPVKKP